MSEPSVSDLPAAERPATAPQELSGMAPDSLLQLVFPSDPQLSPDGARAAFVLTRIEEEHPQQPDPEFAKPRYRSRVMLAGPDGTRELSGGKGRDGSPRWSPDGRQLAFLSDRDTQAGKGEKNQLFVLPLEGGEARQITRLKSGVSGLQWSPDGRFLSFLSRGDAEDKRDERGEARAVTDVRYRFNGRGMLPDTPAVLYLHDLERGETRLWHQPQQELQDYAWWPDGRGVLFASSASSEDAARWQNEAYELTLAGEVRQLTRWASALGDLAPHPDSVRFAAVGRPPGSRNTHDPHLYLFGETAASEGGSLEGGSPEVGRRMDPHHDFPLGSSVAGDLHVGQLSTRPAWVDEHTLAAVYTVGGSSGLFSVPIEGEVTPRLHQDERVMAAFSAGPRGLAHLCESVTEPPELYLNGVKMTDCAARLGFTPLPAGRVTFQNELGEGEGWVITPPGSGPFPALLNIHGGPHTAYGYGFLHEFQLFAQRGYAVCYSNPRGSHGYGQRWSEDIFGRWGSIDAADILAFLDRCLESVPELDRERAAVMGGSYGGFMTNWLTTTTDRFKAAVTDRSICDLVSFGGTSDIGMRFWDDELGGNFQRAADVPALWAMSPLSRVERVRTPTLVIHSLEDLRCPISQGEQWFAALQLHGVESRFVRFPGENHELSRSGRPDRRVRRLEEYLGWLEQYL